jgi:phenylacetate-CoA ligase
VNLLRLLLSASALPNAMLAERRYNRPSPHWRDDVLKRLQRFARYAYDHSSFYHQCWDEAGTHPAQMAAFEDFARWPVIPQKVWRDLPDAALRSEHTGRTVFTRQTSSTSSSTPLIIPFTLRDEWQLRAFLFQTQMHQHISLLERKLAMAPRDPRYLRKHHVLSRLDRSLADPGSPEHLQALSAGRQAVITGNPFIIWRAVVAAVRAGIKLPSHRLMQIAGEVLTDSMRRTLEQELGGQIVEIYGATDYGRLGIGCPHQRIHITPEATYIEILCGDVAAQPEQVGEVVVTNFYSHGRPLVRVRTGDLAVWGGEPCPCGSPMPHFERLLGRVGDRVITPDGRSIYWPEIEQALSVLGETLLGFQVEQTDLESVKVRLSLRDWQVPEAPYHASLNALFAGMQVSIELTDTFTAMRSGKTRVIMGV